MISVIIPTHRRADLLENTINSVLNQTYKNIEIIVVSDGYDEKTEYIMERIAKRNVKFFSYKDNKGANYARNYGVECSLGEYIAFLDDDDQWVESKLEKQLNLIEEKKEFGLIYTGNKQVYIDSNDSFTYEPNTFGDLSEKIFSKNYIGSTSSVLMRKDVFNQAKGFDINLGAMQDYDLWIRVCQITEIGVISEPLLIYNNDRSREQISSQITKYERASIQIREKYKEKFENYPDLEKDFDSFISKVLIKKYLRNDQNKKARELSKLLLKQDRKLSNIVYYVSTFFSYNKLLKIKSFF